MAPDIGVNTHSGQEIRLCSAFRVGKRVGLNNEGLAWSSTSSLTYERWNLSFGVAVEVDFGHEFFEREVAGRRCVLSCPSRQFGPPEIRQVQAVGLNKSSSSTGTNPSLAARRIEGRLVTSAAQTGSLPRRRILSTMYETHRAA
jgi:hypothetical protein